jgi:hypothetical protein
MSFNFHPSTSSSSEAAAAANVTFEWPAKEVKKIGGGRGGARSFKRRKTRIATAVILNP